METVAIHLITPASIFRDQVAHFINSQYERRMNVTPSLPEVVFAAFKSERVIATIGLEFAEEETLIPCEKIFSFEWSLLPLKASRSLSAQYCRWAVTDRSVSNKILHAATIYALERGKKYGWCELKPLVAARLRQLGVGLHEIMDAEICIVAIDDAVLHYYQTEPRPKLYQMELAQMASALQ